jgi:hypothetical protein
MRNEKTILVAQPEENKSLGRPWRRGRDNIKIYLTETGWVIVN